jgi:cold-inducible RNA-binding protein
MKIYVGNMSYNVNSEELRTMFAEFGGVESAEVIIDRSTNRSKGFGFVEMSDDEEAKAAINGLNGKEMDGRTLNVSEARPRAEGPRGGGGGGPRGGGYGGPPRGGGGGIRDSRRF